MVTLPTFAATLGAISNKFSVIGIAETNATCSLKDTFKLVGYNSIYQDAIAGKKKGSGVALYIGENAVKEVTEVRFLGVIFDPLLD